MKTYLCVYLGSAFLALMITPAIIWLAHKIKAVDSPGPRKVHSRPTPRIGGLSIILSTIGLVLPVLFLQNTIGDAFRDIQLHIVVLLSTGTFIFLVGLIDDIKGLRARIKLFAELAAAIAVCVVGIRITSVAVADWLTVNFGWFSWPLTILWIVGITNAVNLSDGLDGLAAGISAVASGVIAILAIWSGQVVMAVLMLALLGSLTGFLFFNFNPARVFLGDCGSLFLGFTIATSSVMCSTKSHALVGLALPFLALGVPIFDTLFSMLRRFLERRSLFAPDRSHFHHRLCDLGFKQHHVVVTIYAVTLLMVGLGLFMMVTRNVNSLILFLCILLLLLLVFRVAGSVRLRETIAGLQRKYAINRQLKKETENFEKVQLHFRQVKTFDQWWQAVCLAAEQLGFMRVTLPLKNIDNPHQTLTWQRDGNGAERSETIEMKIPIRGTKTDLRLSMVVDVNIGDCLESAGRRAALFGRLIDEHYEEKFAIRNSQFQPEGQRDLDLFMPMKL
jgi:UDP-GlcNAc:undecaprenyl-phosphate GlcNAc-1-phosphate transferase